jgi:small subunit ribosomal protein S16
MLAIRMQRLGRKGHPTYRVVVQDVRQTPTSGKYVAMLGSYDPHSKTTTLVKEKAQFYIDHGAQPSDRVVRLFAAEGITLPSWVKQPSQHERTIRNADKLRKNRPAEEPKAETPAEETPEEEPVTVEEPTTEEIVSTEAEAPLEPVVESDANEVESGETAASDSPVESAENAEKSKDESKA